MHAIKVGTDLKLGVVEQILNDGVLLTNGMKITFREAEICIGL